MDRGRGRDPSPLRSGILHAGLSAAVFGGIIAVIGAGVHFTGDASAAGPRQVIALFGDAPVVDPGLSGRLPAEIGAQSLEAAEESQLDVATLDEPTLDVSMPETVDQNVSIPSPVQPEGIRINGKFVPNGQSLSQVSRRAAETETSRPTEKKPISTEGLYERTSAGSLSKITEDGRTVAAAYARPFSNPEGKPAVSLIIGGLGLKSNGRYSVAAIDELPPEITLSFVANAINLNTLVRRARAKGHEVIIEAPMEDYESRRRSDPRHLSTARSASENLGNLRWALSRTSGYFAIMNYEGGKFATDSAAVAPMMNELSRRGVAFIETGSIPGSVFAVEAARASNQFAISSESIDAHADGNAIEERLKELERLALENGTALGTGFPYPVTIDTVKAWAERLEAKGIVLAPASHTLSVPKVQPASIQQVRAATSDGAR